MQEPIGFRYFNFGVLDKDIDRVAVNYFTGFPVFFPLSAFVRRVFGARWEEIVRISNDPRFMKEIIPSVNIVSTADEMSQFFQLLLNNGELDGVRIFSRQTVHNAIKKKQARGKSTGLFCFPCVIVQVWCLVVNRWGCTDLSPKRLMVTLDSVIFSAGPTRSGIFLYPC